MKKKNVGKKVARGAKERVLILANSLLKWYVYLIVPLCIFMNFMQIKRASSLNIFYESMGYPKESTFVYWIGILINLVIFISYFIMKRRKRRK